MGAVKLPEREGLRALARILGGTDGETRLVGGAVRDTLAGEPVKDIDLATRLAPEEVLARLEKARIKAVPTGIAHGTITAVLSSGPVEVTTLRRDVSTDGRRATIAYTDDWREDAARRDFTINALYADPESGEVFDYFGGLSDLDTGLVRFIGDPEARIAEDHLRILRFFRFHTRFGKGAPDQASLNACMKAADSLSALSAERIADELLKLLSLPDPANSVQLMIDGGILAHFLPEAEKSGGDAIARLVQREQSACVTPSPIRRLAALLPCDATTTDRVAKRLKLSNKHREELAALASVARPYAQQARSIAYRLGMEAARDLIMLRADDREWQSALAALDNWTPPIFPIKGGMLIARGLPQGKLVTETLRAVENQWIDEGFPDPERANAIADQLVTSALHSAKKA